MDVGHLFQRWQDGWGDLFRMVAGIGISAVVPGLITLPYYLVFDVMGAPAFLPHPLWAWALAFVLTGPLWATLAKQSLWPSRP